MTEDKQGRVYMYGGVLLTLAGIVWTLFGDTTNVTFKTVEGIGVFAALYVIAQSAERVTEWVVDLLALIDASPEERKEAALQKVRAANSTLNGNPTLADFGPQLLAADSTSLGSAVSAVTATTEAATAEKTAGEKEVKEARKDITFLAHGVSIAVCALAVNGLNYGLLSHIGAVNINADIDRLFTVIAAAGGTKALHELIGRVQKAKETAEAGAAK